MGGVTDDLTVQGAEAALLGEFTVSEADAWLADVVQQLTGSRLAEVLFRSGRIDAVYGLLTADGRRLLLKLHRPPVDLGTRRATATAQHVLAAAGFPCAEPVVQATRIGERVVSLETLLDAGTPGNGHDPAVRRAIAAGLAAQLHLLPSHPELVAAGRNAPAWCRYQDGPWPPPHDSFFDFRQTPSGWSWLDGIAQRASDQLRLASDGDEPLAVAHADWYCGNLRFDGSTLVACFDWDLVSDTVPVIAGLTAGFHTHGTTEGAEQADPSEVLAFLTDFEEAYGSPFDERQQRVAAGAATWSICYTARCNLQMLTGDPEAGTPLALLARQGEDYLALRW